MKTEKSTLQTDSGKLHERQFRELAQRLSLMVTLSFGLGCMATPFFQMSFTSCTWQTCTSSTQAHTISSFGNTLKDTPQILLYPVSRYSFIHLTRCSSVAHNQNSKLLGGRGLLSLPPDLSIP